MALNSTIRCAVSLAVIFTCQGQVIYQVFSNDNPTCDESLIGSGPGNALGNELTITQAGECQDFGQGASAYNAIELLSCSDECLCFRQYARADASDAPCDASVALGNNVKEACFNQCLKDCNGDNCGLTATTSQTQLKLLGSGPICANPMNASTYSCATTGMITTTPTTTQAPTMDDTTGGPSNGATPVILDYDANIDDVVALPYLAKLPGYEIKAVIMTGTGFASITAGLDNTYRLLELLGMGSLPVGKGPMYSSDQWSVFPGGCPYTHLMPKSEIFRADCQYGVIDSYLPYSPRHVDATTPSSAAVYKSAVEAGAHMVVSLGPLTSLYDFKVQYPNEFAMITSLWAMMGAVNVPGNIFTHPNSPAEFNAIGDPHAAKAVFESTSLSSITIIPLDATNDVMMTAEYISQLQTLTTPEGMFISALTTEVQQNWWAGQWGFYGWVNESGVSTAESVSHAYFFWDPLAIGVLANSSIATMVQAPMVIPASTPPDLDVDGQTQINAMGRTVTYAAGIPLENRDVFRSHMLNVLGAPMMGVTQPTPLRPLLESNDMLMYPTTNDCQQSGFTDIIFDHDANIDDVVAVAYMAKLPMYRMKAVIMTATGFTNGVDGTQNTFQLLAMLGLNTVDVGIGPLHGKYQDGAFPPKCDYAQYVPQGEIWKADSLWGVHDGYLPFCNRSVSLSTPMSKDVYKMHVDAGVHTVLATGPLTSLWDFKNQYPSSFAQITHLYAMIGAVYVPGNVWTYAGSPAEFNAIGDPHAAADIFSTDGLSITIIPLDATEMVPITPDYMNQLAMMTTPEGMFVSELTNRVRDGWWAGVYGFYGWADANGTVTAESVANAYFFWDPLAVALMADPSMATWHTANITVVASDPMDMSVDGKTMATSDGTGKAVTFASHVSPAQAALVRQHLIDALQAECISMQPPSLAAAVASASAGSCSSNWDCTGDYEACITANGAGVALMNGEYCSDMMGCNCGTFGFNQGNCQTSWECTNEDHTCVTEMGTGYVLSDEACPDSWCMCVDGDSGGEDMFPANACTMDGDCMPGEQCMSQMYMTPMGYCPAGDTCVCGTSSPQPQCVDIPASVFNALGAVHC